MTNKKKKAKDVLKEANDRLEEANARIEIAEQKEAELVRLQSANMDIINNAKAKLKDADEDAKQQRTLLDSFQHAVLAINDLKSMVERQGESVVKLTRENFMLKQQVHRLMENEEAKENKSRKKNVIITRDGGQGETAAVQLSKSTKKSKNECEKLIKFVKTESNYFKVALKENAQKIISTQKRAKASPKEPMKIKADSSKITRVKKYILGE